MPKIRVLLIEDNSLFREGIKKMLNAEPDIRVVASPVNGNAVERVVKLKPDVVLLDLGLKHHDSLALVKSLKEQYPEAHVVAMDLLPAHAEVVEFVKAGVAGFILKDANLDTFLNTIRSVAKGAKVLPPPLMGSLFSQIVEHAIQSGKVEKVLTSIRLTRREREVIAQIASGKSNKEIANALHLAIYTVKSHVHNILEKLALHTRLELSTFAHERGLTEPKLTEPTEPTDDSR